MTYEEFENLTYGTKVKIDGVEYRKISGIGIYESLLVDTETHSVHNPDTIILFEYKENNGTKNNSSKNNN